MLLRAIAGPKSKSPSIRLGLSTRQRAVFIGRVASFGHPRCKLHTPNDIDQIELIGGAFK